jgi:ABC-type transporter Mla MlaB component
LRFVLYGSVIAMTRDSVHVFKMSGDAGLRSAQEIAESLRQALAEHDTIRVSTDAVTTADITTIQILLAARKQALASGKSLSLAAPPSGALSDLLIQTGCLSADGRPLIQDGEFWTPAKGKAA